MKRKLIHQTCRALAMLCASACFFMLGGILWAICHRGWPALSWEFFSDQIRLAGADGGIVYNLLGTVLLVSTAFLISAPIALSVSLLHSVYLRGHRLRSGLTGALYLLNGVPSIVFGIFGMLVFVQALGWGKSWLAGGIVLGFMILPTVAVALVERMERLPVGYLEAAAALGLRRAQIIRSVILPQSLGGLVTGLLIGLARAAGETAPIMFTATIFAGATIPSGIKDNPVLSLPYHIFVLAQDSFDPSAGSRLWGTALTLLVVVIILSALALPARLKLHEEARS